MTTFMSCRWLLPEGLVVESIRREADSITVAARSAAGDAACPSCGGRSRRVHSRYHRTLSVLPCSDRVLRISVMVRRFRCTMAPCPARIFAERLGVAIAAPFARRTSRLERLGHHLGLALGGRPGAGLAARLRLPFSRDTLLRTLRRRAVRPRGTPTVIGIDDWAWRRGQRYGTLICDLQRRQIIDLLPDREPATLDAWLAAHPEIAIVARDRGGGYGQAVTRVRPGVLQVADRWHLLANASGRQPGRGPPPDDRDPAHDRHGRCRSRAAHPCRADPARRLPATRAGERRDRGARAGRDDHPGDRPPHRLQPQDGPAGRAWRVVRCLPLPDERARALARSARSRMDHRMPQRCRALAATAGPRLPGKPTGRGRVGDAPAA